MGSPRILGAHHQQQSMHPSHQSSHSSLFSGVSSHHIPNASTTLSFTGERSDESLEPPYVQKTTISFHFGTEYDWMTGDNDHHESDRASKRGFASNHHSKHPLSRCCLFIQKGYAYHMAKKRAITNREHISTLVPFTFAHSVPFKMEMMLYAKDTRYERHKIYVQVFVRENYKIDEALTLERKVHVRKAVGKWTIRHAPIIQVSGPTEVEFFILEKRIDKLLIQQNKLAWREQIRSGKDFSERTPSLDSSVLTRQDWDSLYGVGGESPYLALMNGSGSPSQMGNDEETNDGHQLAIPLATHRSISTNDLLKSARSVRTHRTPRNGGIVPEPIPDWDTSTYAREFDRSKYSQRPRKYSLHWSRKDADPNQYDRSELFRTLQQEHEDLLQKMLDTQEHPPTTTEEFLRRQQRINGEGNLPQEGESMQHAPTPPLNRSQRADAYTTPPQHQDVSDEFQSLHTGSPYTVPLNHSLSSTPSPSPPQQKRRHEAATPRDLKQHIHHHDPSQRIPSQNKPSLMRVDSSPASFNSTIPTRRSVPSRNLSSNPVTTASSAPYEPQKPSSPRIHGTRDFGALTHGRIQKVPPVGDSAPSLTPHHSHVPSEQEVAPESQQHPTDINVTSIPQRRTHADRAGESHDSHSDISSSPSMRAGAPVTSPSVYNSQQMDVSKEKGQSEPIAQPSGEEPHTTIGPDVDEQDIYAGFEDWKSKQSSDNAPSDVVHQPFRKDPPQINQREGNHGNQWFEEGFGDDESLSLDTLQDAASDSEIRSMASSGDSYVLTTTSSSDAFKNAKQSRLLFRRTDLPSDLLNRLNSFAFDEF